MKTVGDHLRRELSEVCALREKQLHHVLTPTWRTHYRIDKDDANIAPIDLMPKWWTYSNDRPQIQ